MADVFQKEQAILAHARAMEKKDISPADLKLEYSDIVDKYDKLLSQTMKLTRVGDMNYNKIMVANEKIRKQSTKLENLNQKLREANATKDKFYSIIAHDLRNPLQFLLLSSDLVSDEMTTLPDNAIKKFIGKVLKTAGYLSELLENLLQWSLSQYGEIGCHPQTLDLFMIATETNEYFIDIAREKKITLLLQILPQTFVYADVQMLKAIFRNLISNAIKFTNRDGMVTISAHEEKNVIIISIADTGVGISQSQINSLFKIGSTIPTAGTAKEKGSGLGLILCQEFIAKNKGKLWVTSEPGKGSTFNFSLPKKK